MSHGQPPNKFYTYNKSDIPNLRPKSSFKFWNYTFYHIHYAYSSLVNV